MDGAVAVICDTCLIVKEKLKYACRGYPAEDGRIPIGELTGDFCHDPNKHEDEEV